MNDQAIENLIVVGAAVSHSSSYTGGQGDLNEREILNQLMFGRLPLRYPIIQAPMAGGGDTPALIAAVSNAGGLGCYGAAYSSPAQIVEVGESIRSLTGRPFGVNLFAPQHLASATEGQISSAVMRLATFYKEVGIDPPSLPLLPLVPGYTFEEQLEAALNIGASVFSFTFGILTSKQIEKVRSHDLLIFGTATTVDEALDLQNIGVDAVIAQSAEAGGHRGSFRDSFKSSMVGGLALVPQIVDAVAVPVIASGGVMDGRGIAAALALGAEAVQMGTAFLTCREAGIPEIYKSAILQARENDIVTTRAFSGRPARGIRNRFIIEMAPAESANTVLPFPLQNALTRPLRAAAAKMGNSEFLSLWAGQGVRMARRSSANELINSLVQEMYDAINSLRRATSEALTDVRSV